MEKSHAEIMLEKIESYLQGKGDIGLAEWQVDNRAIKNIPVNELEDLRLRYKAEVDNERHQRNLAAGGANKKKIRVTL